MKNVIWQVCELIIADLPFFVCTGITGRNPVCNKINERRNV